jgi:hypothetical protein
MTERTDPQLWEKIKKEITNKETAGTKAGQWSGRKSQMAVREYKKQGGGYLSPKDENNSLVKWTKQNWRTKSGLPSSLTGERYLPYKAIKSLSPHQYELTTFEKQKAMRSGKQYSKQPVEIADITKKFR